MRHVVQLALIAATAAGAACSVSMPDQDRRIYTATPVAKLSVADLWKDFHDDASQASARYVGKAIDISGSASAVGTADTTKSTTLLFKQTADQGVQASLLDDEAADIFKRAAAGERLTLRCYCAGLSGNVILKSCVRALR